MTITNTGNGRLLECDGCARDPAYLFTEGSVLQYALDSGWKRIRGRWLCPPCKRRVEGYDN